MVALLLIANVASTLALTGLIWTIQVVVYPSFALVSPSTFALFHERHSTRITYVVAPLMLVELVTAIGLAMKPPAGVAAEVFWLGFSLVVLAWVSTAGLQVPAHRRLATHFDLDVQKTLVHTNWIRTFAWTIRGIVLSFVVASLLCAEV